MVKQYKLLDNSQREKLCKLIHTEGLNIKEAALLVGIPYANAKAVNKIFRRELRSDKKHKKYRQVQDEVPSNQVPTVKPRIVEEARIH
jgi:uncharacterized protein with von Willebrand factor type A (vWA) domain